MPTLAACACVVTRILGGGKNLWRSLLSFRTPSNVENALLLTIDKPPYVMYNKGNKSNTKKGACYKMTTEEMLLQLIEGQKQMSTDISNLKEGQKQTNERLDKMDNRLDEQYNMIHQLTLNQEAMQKDIKSIKVTLENDISPAIKMLSELQLDNSKRFRQLEKDVQEIKDNSAIDEVIHELKDMKMI